MSWLESGFCECRHKSIFKRMFLFLNRLNLYRHCKTVIWSTGKCLFLYLSSREYMRVNNFIASNIGFLNEKKKIIKIRFFWRFCFSNSNWNIELRLSSVDLKSWLLYDVMQLIKYARLDIQLLSKTWCQNHWFVPFVTLYNLNGY